MQEYFFEDWERICWVLNDHRKTNASNRFLQQPDIDLLTLFGSDIGATLQQRQWRINDDAFERIEAYRGIIDHAVTTRVASNLAGTQPVTNDTEVAREVQYDGHQIRQLISQTIEVIKDGAVISPVLPLLKTLGARRT